MARVGNIETHDGTSGGGFHADPYQVNSTPSFDRRVARELSPLQFIEQSTEREGGRLMAGALL